MNRFFRYCFAFCAVPLSCYCQEEKGTITLVGTVISQETDYPLEGVTVGLYKGPMTQKTLLTRADGKFEFKVLVNTGNYTIKFFCPRHVSMFCQISATVPPSEESTDFKFDFKRLPMWADHSDAINTYAFRDYPFAKVSFIGKKIQEDEYYFQQFKSRVEDLSAFEVQKKKETEARQKSDQEKLAKQKAEEEKLKKQKDEQERLAKQKAEEERLAKQKAEEEKLKKQKEERERLARENARQELLAQQEALKKLMEKEEEMLEEKAKKELSAQTDAMRLKQEKEYKQAVKKKNQAIRSQYENELLLLIAESERNEKEKAFLRLKSESENNQLVERMKRERELKENVDKLMQEISYVNRQQKQNETKQLKSAQMKSIIEMASYAERSSRVKKMNGYMPTGELSVAQSTTITEKTENKTFYTLTTTTVTSGLKKDVYKKENYIWGIEYFYKNNEPIEEQEYLVELSKYTSVKKAN
jgi:hypothetical protein